MQTIIENVEDFDAPVAGAYRTAATSKGKIDGRVSAQWMSRPDDQKFLSLDELRASVFARSSECVTRNVTPQSIRVDLVDDGAGMNLDFNDGRERIDMTHWSFGQMCSLTRCPADYLRRLPVQLAGINLQHGLMAYQGEAMKSFVHSGAHELRAMTGVGYGRIFDHTVVEQVQRIAGNGVGDTCWKVPGTIDWGSHEDGTVLYNPYVDITKDTTTLYASDRDVYIFLVDDTHPIEVGKLPDGSPDLMFRGFIVWNSEVGAKSFGLATMLLRGVCQNRNLWGVEGTKELRIRHSAQAPLTFAREFASRLKDYSNAPTAGIVAKVAAAKATIVAKTDEERVDFLTAKAKLSKPVAERAIEAVMKEELHPATSIWDMVQGITAVARKIQHQDARLDLETKAGKLMDAVRP